MKKLLIITTLAISSLTYGGELLLGNVGAGSEIKEVCVDLFYPENEECFKKFDNVELDENNQDHVEMMVSAEDNLPQWALYSCEKISDIGRKKLRVVQISEPTFEIRFRATNFGSLGELEVIAWADFKCILP